MKSKTIIILITLITACLAAGCSGDTAAGRNDRSSAVSSSASADPETSGTPDMSEQSPDVPDSFDEPVYVGDDRSDEESTEEVIQNNPDHFPEYECKGEATVDGTFLCAVNYLGAHYLVDFNNKGEIISKQKQEIPQKQGDTPGTVTSYKASDDGNTRYFCLTKTRESFSDASLIIMDKNGDRS